MALGSGLWLPQDKPDYPELDPLDPINLGLVGVWPLGEGRGLTARDISRRNNHGTLGSLTSWGGGRFGATLSFPGTNADTNMVTVADSSSVNVIGNITIACWVYPKISNAYQVLMCRDNGAAGARDYAMFLSTNGVSQIFVAVNSGGGGFNNNVSVTPNWVVNQWNFIAVTADGTSIKTYVNGVLANTTASAAVAPTGAHNLTFGRLVGGFSLNGLLDIPRLWNRALSSTEITRLYVERYAGLLQDDTTDYRIAVVGGSNGVGSSVGAGAATGVGASLSASVGSSAGTGAATGIGQGIDNSVGSSAGSATVTGVGKSLANSVGSSAGVATAPGVGTFTGGGTRGTAAGVSTVSGVGASLVAATGTALGTSTAVAVAVLPYWFQNPAPLPVWGVSAPPSGAWSAVAPSGAAWTKQFP